MFASLYFICCNYKACVEVKQQVNCRKIVASCVKLIKNELMRNPLFSCQRQVTARMHVCFYNCKPTDKKMNKFETLYL